MMWFWVGYISIGLWLLMPGIVYAWDTKPQSITIRILASIVAVLIWPVVFVSR